MESTEEWQAARIAELEARLQAVLRREEDANKAAFAHMRRIAALEANGIAARKATAKNYARAEAAEAEVARLREALRHVMIGGNHLVTLLPEVVLSPETPPLEALEIMGAGNSYDAWCCWRSIMLARAALQPKEGK